MLSRIEFTKYLLRTGNGKITYQHAEDCTQLKHCTCRGKAGNKHQYLCPSISCACEGIFHGIGLKGRQR